MDSSNNYLWWQTGVIYQIYPRSFKDSNGDGIGDLAGIIQKLDYLTEILGVDAIWLSPFYPSPMADFGYDVADYVDVDPMFGDLPTFDELVSQSHKRGLKVMIDLVINHTSDQHAWFQESRSSRDNPKRNWYVWEDPKPDGSPPNNWLSVFGGSAWDWDENTGQYYLHSFLKEQPDLNWRNPQVKGAMFDVVRFWLERGVDGFRIDVAHYIMKDPYLRDNPLNPAPHTFVHRRRTEYDLQLHIYDKGHPDVHQVYREFRQVLDEFNSEQPRMAIGEIHIFDWSEWISYYGENLDELHMPFNFTLLYADWNAASIRQVVESLEAALPEGAWPNYVLGNHDEPRLVSRIGRRQARMAAMLLLTLRGTPTLYNGDEIGMTDGDIPAQLCLDPAGRDDPAMGRDRCRTPMQWDSSPYAGFSPPSARSTWLPVTEDFGEVNVASQLDQPDSMLNLYRTLLAYRRSSPVLRWGTFHSVDIGLDDCFVYLRRLPDEPDVLIALNFSSDERRLALPGLGKGTIAISTFLDRSGEVNLDHLTLRSDEGLLIKLV
jgi:alpha-glucosidase